MRELDDKEEVIKSVQEKAESLLLENHPARLTIEVEPTDACSLLLMANRIIHLNFKTSFLWIKYKKSWNYYLKKSAPKKDISVVFYLRSYCYKPVGEVEHKWRSLAESSSFPDNEREWEGYMMKVVTVRQTSRALFCKASKIIFPFCSSYIYTCRHHGPYQNIPHLWYFFIEHSVKLLFREREKVLWKRDKIIK